MGLIQNGYRDTHGCLKFAGAGFSNGAYPAVHHYNFSQTGRKRNLTAGEGITDKKTSVPVGYRPPDCWLMAQKTGGMGVTGRQIEGTGAISGGNLAGGLNGETTIAGTGGLSADMSLIIIAIATLSGTGGLTVDATGSITASADLTGSSTMSAPLGAIVGAVAELAGTGGVSGTLRGDGYMSSDIAPATTVSASVIATAVWDYVDRTLTASGALTTEEHEQLMKTLTTAKFMGLK